MIVGLVALWPMPDLARRATGVRVGASNGTTSR
jgi:MHS family proline/betaine transporter-like MFS transporter